MNQLWPIVTVIALLIGIAGISLVAAAKRRKALEELARRIGFTFDGGTYDADEVAGRYHGFEPFDRGHGRRASNLLTGTRGRIEFELFDYRFTTGSGKHKQTHRHGIVAAHLPMNFTSLHIRPEGWFDKLATLAGFDDINFESNEFSARYHVACADRQFAYALIHPQAIEYLLRCPPLHWQMNGGVILVQRRGVLKPEEMLRVIETVEGFVRTIPAFVREDHALR